MPIGEFIIGAIGEMIAYFIFELIINGIGAVIRKIYYWIRKLLTGKEREIPELERIEKRYLFKKFRLRSDLHEQIPKGTRGTVLEVINERTLSVEFEGNSGQPITIDSKKTFKIRRSRVMLERKKRTLTKA